MCKKMQKMCKNTKNYTQKGVENNKQKIAQAVRPLRPSFSNSEYDQPQMSLKMCEIIFNGESDGSNQYQEK